MTCRYGAQRYFSSVSYAFICTLAVSQAAAAQSGQPDDAVDLPPIVVEGSGGKAAGAGSDPLSANQSSVSVMTGAQAAQTGVRDQRDLSQSFANVTGFDAGGARMTTFAIRGMREFGYQSTPGAFPAIAYYMDDVPALTTLARASLFMNLDEVSVLRGPQISGYGFSRPGGVIDVHTADLTDKPSGYVSTSFGNYRAWETSGGVSAPIGSEFFLSADGVIQDRNGFYRNTSLSDSYGDKTAYAGRARLTWRPSDSFQLDFTSQHERFRDQTDPFVPLSQLRSSGRYKVSYDDPGHERISQNLEALRIKSSFDAFDLLSVTAYRRSTWDFVNDGDGTAEPLDPANPYSRYSGYTHEKVRSLTQELRVRSNDDRARLQWSGGLFAARTNMDIATGALLYPSGSQIQPAKARNDDFAAFGELSYALTETLRIQPGLRYEAAGRRGSNAQVAPIINSGSKTFSAVLPSIAMVYAPSPLFSAFAKYTRGFRPGGFNAHKRVTDPGDYEFAAETSDNYEIGFKSSHLDDRLSVNGSLFLSNYDDYQVLNQFSAQAFGVNNAQKARTYGGELELAYKLTPEISLSGGAGVTHARYLKFENGYGDFSHKRVPFVPRFTLNYGVDYQAPWGGFAGVQARTTGRYALDDANHSSQKTATLVNAQIGFRKDWYEVAMFGRNIFNERYIANVYDFSGTGVGAIGNLGDPATYGVRAKATF
ncbi:MAG TPA: TonB-dependent receptor [Hansschlegelia sp.]